MNTLKVKDAITEILLSCHPKVKVKFSVRNDVIFCTSFFDKNVPFVKFQIRDDSINNIEVDNNHLQSVKQLFSLNILKWDNFNIVDTFFDKLISNKNFNKSFKISCNFDVSKLFCFSKEGEYFKIKKLSSQPFFTYVICNFGQSYFQCSLENQFKLTRDGKMAPVPMIRQFEHQKNEQLFAFNIYKQTIHKIKKNELFFEDLFQNNQEFDSDYHGDLFVDEYIDNYIINSFEDDDDIRELLIALPRERLNEKLELLSMYMI